MILSIITVGQVPVFFPDAYDFIFEEAGPGGGPKQTVIPIWVTQRVWFWDLLVFNKKFERKAGQALLGAVRAGNLR